MRIDTVAIAGIGLIGGSIARDLAARNTRVLGWDRDRAALERAHAQGVVAHALPEDFTGIGDADVVVLALPVLAACDVLARMAPRCTHARLVTDTGSTKASIVAASERAGIGARFVGAHPLAGDHRAGWEAGRPGLIAGATVYLTPAASAREDARTLAEDFWRSLGGAPQYMDAGAHDARLAWTSHLPQVVSSALALTLAQHRYGRADLGPGGRDVTRLAASSPEMWLEILRDNRNEVLAALRAAEGELAGLRAALVADSGGELADRLARAAAWT